ncbi:MAG: ABC-F family ATP-binding cassette domain-containing protein [Phycisphaerae bacterium]|nr:ABC-F family ATP-binding cassette domain-containing protein [Phycisphaerae bacterium]
MAIVRLQDVHIGFAVQEVLHGLDWTIQRGEKVGLIGANGSGKTTLFKLILGQLQPQMGTVTRTRGLQIAYLPQEPTLDSAKTVHAEVADTFSHVQELEQRVAEVAQELADHHDTDRLDELMAEYDELHQRLEAAGGYKYDTFVNEVLGGLGFAPADYAMPIAALSGGQKCRVALAKLLLQEADLLLLDEPTNHLDIEATRFLEKFLAGYHGAAVVVSHDRYLLDRVVDKIADLDERKVTVYPCGYSDYAEAKRVRRMTAEREFVKQQEWLKHQREYAERVKADKSRAKQSRGRLRYLDRMEREGKVLRGPTKAKRRMALDFEPSRRAGDMVLRCEGVRKAYGDVVLFDDFTLDIYRGEKIGIVGPNGVGKTTLLKMALRKVEPDAGEIRLFENLDVGYYDQEHADLNPNHRVIDEIEPGASGPLEAALRSYLARFLFSGDAVYKRIGDLSGGEQSRVVLAKLVWAKPQVLILDEPTNHLDIPAKEVLEEALIAYEGAILLVSHDRYFLDRVVNEMLVLPERAKYELIAGNWTTYEQRVAEREAQARAAAEEARAVARGGRKPRSARKGPAASRAADDDSPFARWSLQRIEDAIIDHEERLAEAERQFADPAVYRDADRARTLRNEVAVLREELADLNGAWEARAD